MADSPSKPRRGLAIPSVAYKLGAAWLILAAFFAGARWLDTLDRFIRNDLLVRWFGTLTAYWDAVHVYELLVAIPAITFVVTLVFGTGAAVLGALVRMVARARVRAGQADFLDRMRAWTAAHRRATGGLAAAPSLVWTAWILHVLAENPVEEHHNLSQWLGMLVRAAVPLLASTWGMFAATRSGFDALLAPTMGGVAPSRVEIRDDEIVFDAVAVTRRTVAIVAAFSAIMFSVPVLVNFRAFQHLFPEQGLWYLMGAYVTLAAGGAYSFRKASRISVGLDGVHIRGTSRARFFAYRDVDAARVRGVNVELVRAGKVILTLQLHGEDAARRDAIVARITQHIERIREGRGATAAGIVAASTQDDLDRAADGAGDYRAAPLTREQLWALVEGPEVEASARRAAAQALVKSGDESERARLRVAAEHCAEPQMRVALSEIAEVDAAETVSPPQLARGA
jgi:hypothetical protein